VFSQRRLRDSPGRSSWLAVPLEIPEKKKRVHEMSIPIRWGDMDAMGHLNNARAEAPAQICV